MHTALYVRVSTKEQRLDSQLLELAHVCKARGWQNQVTYADKLSGMCERPEFERMLTDCRLGKVDRVVCFKLDRIGRSLSHLALVIDELARLGVPLICVSQGIDTSNDNPVGKLQLGVLMAVAEFERGIIRERVMAGQASAKARGVAFGRKPFLRARGAEVAKLRDAGLGVRAIARQLSMPPSSVLSVIRSLPK